MLLLLRQPPPLRQQRLQLQRHRLEAGQPLPADARPRSGTLRMARGSRRCTSLAHMQGGATTKPTNTPTCSPLRKPPLSHAMA